MRENKRRKDIMKKFLATILTFCFILGISCQTDAAVTPADLEGKSDDIVRISDVYSQKDLSFQYLETFLKESISTRNDPAPLWVIVSLNHQESCQFYYFPDKELEGVETYYYDTFWDTYNENTDFIQTGVIMDSRNKETIKNSFENNPLKTATDLLIANPEKAQKFYESSLEFNTQFHIPETPVYWNIEDIDSEKFILEVSIGKYQIQVGDCLSLIAERFGTSVEQLVKLNPKITNPDLIYAGDFLAIGY